MQLDWSTIDTVLLDMDGTLLDLHYDNHFWLHHLPNIYAQAKGQPREQVMVKIESLLTNHKGTLNWYCVDFWSDQLELDILHHSAEVAHKIAYRPTAEAFLQACAQRVDDLRLVTNAHRKLLNLKIQQTQLDQYFDMMVCSHELDAPKEHENFWRELEKRKSFDPSRTVFIDDGEPMLDAAADHGIQHIYSIAQPDSVNVRLTDSKYPMLESLLSL